MSGRPLTAQEVGFGPDASYEQRLTAVLETERVKREARRQLDAEDADPLRCRYSTLSVIISRDRGQSCRRGFSSGNRRVRA